MKAIHVAFGLLAAVAATAANAADKVYKWKDANGITHFSDAPPPKGTEFDNVRVVNQSAAITQTVSPTTIPEAEAANPADPNQAKPNKDTREARCAASQQRVRTLEGPQDVNISRDGKLVPLEGAERKAELDIATASVAALCSEKPGS